MSGCSGFMYIRTYPLAPIMPSWTSWRPIASIASKKRTETSGMVTKLNGKAIFGTLVGSLGFGRTRMKTRTARMGRTMKFGNANENGNTTMRSRSKKFVGCQPGTQNMLNKCRGRTCDYEDDQCDDASPACIRLILRHSGVRD